MTPVTRMPAGLSQARAFQTVCTVKQTNEAHNPFGRRLQSSRIERSGCGAADSKIGENGCTNSGSGNKPDRKGDGDVKDHT